jgi:hypothetical protein
LGHLLFQLSHLPLEIDDFLIDCDAHMILLTGMTPARLKTRLELLVAQLTCTS